jgi:transposase
LDYLKQQQQVIKKLIGDHFDQHPHLKQQRDLLTSIPGIGDMTASVLLAEIRDVSDYNNARQLAAYAGLTPCERSSGTSVKGKTRLSCTGNVRLRKALYLPAVVAMRHNPLLKAMSDQLLGRGKVKMQVIGALIRKLVHLAFGILKSQKPFDPNYLTATP